MRRTRNRPRNAKKISRSYLRKPVGNGVKNGRKAKMQCPPENRRGARARGRICMTKPAAVYLSTAKFIEPAIAAPNPKCTALGLVAFLPQKPTLVLKLGARPAWSHGGFLRGLEMGIH